VRAERYTGCKAATLPKPEDISPIAPAAVAALLAESLKCRLDPTELRPRGMALALYSFAHAIGEYCNLIPCVQTERYNVRTAATMPKPADISPIAPAAVAVLLAERLIGRLDSNELSPRGMALAVYSFAQLQAPPSAAVPMLYAIFGVLEVNSDALTAEGLVNVLVAMCYYNRVCVFQDSADRRARITA
jgi:hypothetical protein